MFKSSPKFYILIPVAVLLAAVIVGISYQSDQRLIQSYAARRSEVVADRNGTVILVRPNSLGYYAVYRDAPEEFKKLLVMGEDRYFLYHFGFNPVSVARAISRKLIGNKNPASSTITQQLAKILLGQENDRTLKNKLREAWYTLSLELFHSKKEILKMYVNSLYFGNRTQGLATASKLYFNKTPELLSEWETTRLLATIKNPTTGHPFAGRNVVNARLLPEQLNIVIPTSQEESLAQPTLTMIAERKQNFKNFVASPTTLEVNSLLTTDNGNSPMSPLLERGGTTRQLTVDAPLTEKLRAILSRHITQLADKNVTNGAIVVLKLPENELLAMVGTPDPSDQYDGHQINMAMEPRPIGSTVKPLIYLKAFEKGLRPYSLVDDQEYKYSLANGFPFYPKNFDREYHGRVTLHYALTNSLNVPTVKVLEYLGLDTFYNFLEKDLHFTPVQPLPKYELGIALGGLEMSLLDLARYISVLPNNGFLAPVTVTNPPYTGGPRGVLANNQSPTIPRLGGVAISTPLKATLSIGRRVGVGEIVASPDTELPHPPLAARPSPPERGLRIAAPQYTQLITKILSDRFTGIDQFNLVSSLNLPWKNYALKTGTSRDFHDSWTIGYTPDFLVGVWVGNSDNTAMDSVSGLIGAGDIWHEAMTLLYNSPYNKNTPFDFSLLKEYPTADGVDWGLPGDEVSKHLNLLIPDTLIISPHQGDAFLLEKNMAIPLLAHEAVTWGVNGTTLGAGSEVMFRPTKAGRYTVSARGQTGKEDIVGIVVNR